MAVCPACGHDNPAGARFCNGCGAPLVSAATPPREERKVVSIVFADLVGSTARAESLDPEDVRAVLSPYHELLRRELEAFGGTVEKFIGDAVVAVFGAPVAHEDDAERAVRASLAIQEAIADLNEAEPGLELEVRIGVNSGEALVDLGARPELGEGMVSGDVINTAARLQSAAPPGGVLVGEQTHRATLRTIEFADHAAIEARGKAEPVPCWLVVSPRSSFGLEDDAVGNAPLVGRAREVSLLADALARVRSDERPQLVTLVGVPGIGKSRLVHELRLLVDADPDLITWRRGRSLPYGEGISYWALGEIVKAQAGILESDGADAAATKLAEAVECLYADRTEAAWVERQLRPLVGLPGVDVRPSRDEAFSAWRRFLEALAEHRPTVLVFEDLHWADDDLLDFVDELTDQADAVPLLVVCTARPELLARRPGWGGGKLNAATVSLSPLSDEDTARLLSSLLGRVVLPAEEQATMLARAEGVPLFAEEYARMLEAGGGEQELPETLQGVVAARIDGLPQEAKALLQDASVLGKVFWTDALRELTGLDDAALDDLLRQLERREFVRRERRSAVEGARQFAFLHALVREVAYGQIPRAARSRKHRATALWIAGLTTDRGDDFAETLVHHLELAVSLGNAAGVDVADLRPTLAKALEDAGDRALALNAVARAGEYYRRAVDSFRRARPRAHLPPRTGAHVGRRRGRWVAAARRGGSATAGRRSTRPGSPVADAARTRALERGGLGARAARPRAGTRGGHGSDRDPRAGSWEPWRCGGRSRVGRTQALPLAREAVEIARANADQEAEAEALNNLAVTYANVGDVEQAFATAKTGLALGLECGSSDLTRLYVNLATFEFDRGNLAEVTNYHRDGLALSVRTGNVASVDWLRAEIAIDAYELGQWDEAQAEASAVLAQHHAIGLQHYMDPGLQLVQVAITLGRTGRLQRDQLDDGLSRARSVGDPQMHVPSLTWAARLFVQAGLVLDADACLNELQALLAADTALEVMGLWTLDAGLALLDRGRPVPPELFRGPDVPWRRATQLLCDGRAGEAADLLHAIGARSLEAEVRLHAARSGEPDGLAHLDSAGAFWRSVGAEARLAELERVRAAVDVSAS